MSDDLTKIRERLAKLMAMANHPNSNPNEAAMAAAMASELAARYSLELNLHQTTGPQFLHGVFEEYFSVPYRTAIWQIARPIGDSFMTRPVILSYDHTHQLRVQFSGREHNVQQSLHWLGYLWETCTRANTEHARRMRYPGPKARQEARVAFRLAFCVAVRRRMDEQLHQFKAKSMTMSDGRSLVLADQFEAERNAINEWLAQRGELPTKQFQSQRVNQLMIAAALAGRDAGNQVSLNDQLEGQQS